MTNSDQENRSMYTAETYVVLNTGETGWCVKHFDDTVCDVYEGEVMAKRIVAFLNCVAEYEKG